MSKAAKPVLNCYFTCPGLPGKVQCLAWKHRSERPVIRARPARYCSPRHRMPVNYDIQPNL